MSKQEKSKWLFEISEQLVKTHLFGTGKITDMVQKTDDLHKALAGPFHCRQDECNKVYKQHSWRVR